jgi:hypothetical protein
LLACAAWTITSRADDPAETSYGRVEGDIDFVVGAGAVFAPRGVRGEVELRARYLDAAGIFVAYEDAPFWGSGAEPGRVLSGGLELRPLFLFRWLQGRETGEPRVDLTIDSIGLELGWTLSAPSGQGLTQSGLQAGLGVEFPILPRASGPWLGFHGGVRWSDAALATGQVSDADDRSGYFAVTLQWHEVVLTHLVDLKDEPQPRR